MQLWSWRRAENPDNVRRRRRDLRCGQGFPQETESSCAPPIGAPTSAGCSRFGIHPETTRR
jgi:hypothetical protein